MDIQKHTAHTHPDVYVVLLNTSHPLAQSPEIHLLNVHCVMENIPLIIRDAKYTKIYKNSAIRTQETNNLQSTRNPTISKQQHFLLKPVHLPHNKGHMQMLPLIKNHLILKQTNWTQVLC